MDYAGTFELQLHTVSLAPAIEAVCPMHVRHRSDHLANMEWQKKWATLPDLCKALETITQAVDVEWERQHGSEKHFHLLLIATIWRTEKGGWPESVLEPKGLTGFPNCILTQLDFSTDRNRSFLEISKTCQITEPDRRDGGDSHRAIYVQKRLASNRAEKSIQSMLDFFRHEVHLDYVFACFEAYSQ
jgi:hypothetical protein